MPLQLHCLIDICRLLWETCSNFFMLLPFTTFLRYQFIDRRCLPRISRKCSIKLQFWPLDGKIVDWKTTQEFVNKTLDDRLVVWYVSRHIMNISHYLILHPGYPFCHIILLYLIKCIVWCVLSSIQDHLQLSRDFGRNSWCLKAT